MALVVVYCVFRLLSVSLCALLLRHRNVFDMMPNVCLAANPAGMKEKLSHAMTSLR